MSDWIKKEDYEEPVCPFCKDVYTENKIKPVDTGRVIEKLDEYLNRNDYEAGRRHLEYWLEEARQGGDLRGELTIQNECMGLYRKTSKKQEAYLAAERGIELIEMLKLENSIICATTLVNAATVYKSFGDSDCALALYEKAKVLYEDLLEPNDGKLGGLYNNMALALSDLEQYEKARELFQKAMDVMKHVRYGELEIAITCLNLADMAQKQYGAEEAEKEVCELVEKAQELLETPSVPRNGYYAFVCEKCAPSFDYHGYFLFAEELRRRSREIYERA